MSIPDQHRLTQAPRAGAVAALLLSLADALAVKVGSDGTDVITVAKSPVPLELGRWLHAELCKHKREVIAAINIPRRWLETRKTRDAVVPISDADREMRDGWRCVPVPPTNDDAWFIVDSSHDWKTTWGRWREMEGSA
jgi:hypothetical protein